VANWPRPVRLSVNVSPLQFELGDIVADVRSALEQSGLPAERLQVEITESLLVTETSHVTEKLKVLRAEGVGVALDDFGTGYSSLSYLGRLPVDTIKIDQSFVRGLPGDGEASAIIRAVLMLSESLGKQVVAEGIENQDQAWLLRLAGCKTGQGYFFSRPGPAEDIVVKLLAAEHDRLSTVMRMG
jgi:EAL domain-containing protein (putative c-di-GMP-specific phosphodiesterase class I)